MAFEHTALDFERPVVELELRLDRLRGLLAESPELEPQVATLERQVEALRDRIFSSLSRWQIVQLARHAARPSPLDYVEGLVRGFVELHGDRAYGDDPAMLGGVGKLDGRPIVILAHARGRSPAEQQARNFGMSRPEGFRKAVRLAKLADRLGLPLVCLVDTPGAYPGDDAEERGQAQAIAECLETMSSVRSPVVSCVVGEGGSGGALALAVADRLLMQEYAVFPVISPEACSSILFRDGAHGPESAEALRPTARDLLGFGLIDTLVPEPPGGAHRNLREAVRIVGASLHAALDSLATQPVEDRLEARYRRLRTYGAPSYGQA